LNTPSLAIVLDKKDRKEHTALVSSFEQRVEILKMVIYKSPGARSAIIFMFLKAKEATIASETPVFERS
jgi:hypothetical protein